MLHKGASSNWADVGAMGVFYLILLIKRRMDYRRLLVLLGLLWSIWYVVTHS